MEWMFKDLEPPNPPQCRCADAQNGGLGDHDPLIGRLRERFEQEYLQRVSIGMIHDSIEYMLPNTLTADEAARIARFDLDRPEHFDELLNHPARMGGETPVDFRKRCAAIAAAQPAPTPTPVLPPKPAGCGGTKRVVWVEAGMMQDCPGCTDCRWAYDPRRVKLRWVLDPVNRIAIVMPEDQVEFISI